MKTKTMHGGKSMRLQKIFVAAALVPVFLASASAQVKPAESTSKVKKVLLYNKIGGWVHVDGRRDLTTAVTNLSKSKKFALQVLDDESALTADYLKDFSLLIWNNNVNGANSVPSDAARKAVIDYLNAGGGWLLVHGAGDHGDTWAGLKDLLGTTFSIHGSQGQADANLDPAASKHKELKWMVEGWPAKFRLHDEWYSFKNSVRPLPNVTIVLTASNGDNGVLRPMADGTNDHVYAWAREVGKGRMYYDAIGHGGNSLYGQADSIVTRILWQHMRYVAGDFQNGCTNPNSPAFNAQARVDDGSCGGTSTAGLLPGGPALTLAYGGRQFTFAFPHAGRFTVELHDSRGRLAWRGGGMAGTWVNIDPGVRPGIYHATARNGKSISRERIVLF